MPRFDTDNDMQTHQIGGNFNFTAVRLSRLGATEYTLVTIAVDVTGSTQNFADGLLLALKTAVKSCKKSPRSDNLLLRVITFSSSGGVTELHGFKPLSEINPDDDYEPFNPYGMTPLFDAVYSAVGSIADMGKQLMDNDFFANGIAFIITDGGDNVSTETPSTIKDLIQSVRREEKLESLLTVLIGINAHEFNPELQDFKNKAELDQYIDAGDATPGKLAKLAAFVSQSVSSQSQSLGTGGPSKTISATI
jgi:uncharacterized protein YegL